MMGEHCSVLSIGDIGSRLGRWTLEGAQGRWTLEGAQGHHKMTAPHAGVDIFHEHNLITHVFFYS